MAAQTDVLGGPFITQVCVDCVSRCWLGWIDDGQAVRRWYTNGCQQQDGRAFLPPRFWGLLWAL